MIVAIMRTSAALIAAVLAAVPIALSSQSAVPTPASVLGFEPGADYKLATYDQSMAYFKKLAASSKYVQLMEAGKTSEGRTFYYALISNPDNLAKIDHYREISQRLAHPQGLTDAEAAQLAREGKAFVHLDGGLHATEVAGAQQTPLLAYDLVSKANDPTIKLILDNDIVMLWPTINPDGQQMVAEAYMAGKPQPSLYQEYVGHDNNRDAYMLNMIESRVMEHAWRQWEPDIIYVQHQSGPFPTRIWLPPFSEPVGTDAPYLMSREVNMIGMAIAKGLEEKGQVGATHMGTSFDAWYPGYIDYAGNFKNIPSFWTETALYNLATPHQYTINEFPQNFRDLRPQSLYSSPWPPGCWRLRDAVDYMETASMATLEYAAKYKDSLLLDHYKAARDQIALGKTEAPFAYVIPQDQRDPVAAVELLRRLAFGGVRVSQLTAAATIDKVSYPAGTWVIPTDQEFAAMAREVLNIQKYPDLRQYPNGPPERPYDAAGWTLPLQMGVHVVAAGTPLDDAARASLKLLGPMPNPKAKPTPYNLADSADAAPFDSVPGIGFDSNPNAAAIVPPAGRLTGSGASLAVDPGQNNAFRAINAAWKQGASVQFVAGSPGSGLGARYVISGLSADAQTSLVNSLALVAERTSMTGTPMKKARVGLFQAANGGSMDEGWTRWLLQQYGFDFVSLHLADFHSPLRDKVDVVIFASDGQLPGLGGGRGGGGGGGGRGGGAGAGRGGGGAGASAPAVPAPLSPDALASLVPSNSVSREGPSCGTTAAAPDDVAGRGGRGGGRGGGGDALTPADLQAFEQFVRGGGTVVCLSGSCGGLIQQFKLPVRNVVQGLPSQDFFLRGSIVEVTTDPSHQVMAGMPPKAAVFVDGSPVFETLEGFKGTVLAKYQETGSPLLSGYLIGEKDIQGKAAALDVQLDAGHVVLFGFRPQWRDQPFGTFRALFNAALFSR